MFSKISLFAFFLWLNIHDVYSISCNWLPLPNAYIAYQLEPSDTITIDGKLNEKEWIEVASTENFVGRYHVYILYTLFIVVREY